MGEGGVMRDSSVLAASAVGVSFILYSVFLFTLYSAFCVP